MKYTFLYIYIYYIVEGKIKFLRLRKIVNNLFKINKRRKKMVNFGNRIWVLIIYFKIV